jgi:hypothetical protein
LYVGFELEGAALAPRNKVNEKFYGKALAAKKILFGAVEDIPTCEPLGRLHTKFTELAQSPDPDPAYAETIAHPFLKTNTNTNTSNAK